MAQFTQRDAFEAVKAFQAMVPQLQAFARNVTGNSKLIIKPHASMTATTHDNVMFIRPPLGLGVNRRHDRAKCSVRDEQYKLICDACDKREVIEFALYHEIAHVIYGSFKRHGSRARKAFEAIVNEFHPREACSHAVDITARRSADDTAITLGAITNRYSQTITNALEDVRVNRAMIKSRAGLADIFEAQYRRLMESDTDLNGRTTSLATEPLDGQFIIGTMIKAMGYSTDGLLYQDVAECIETDGINDIVVKSARIKSGDDSYILGIELFKAAQQLGYLSSVEPCKVPEPEPEPEEDIPSLPGDPDDSGGSGEPEEPEEEDGDGGDSSSGDSSEDSVSSEEDPEASPRDDSTEGSDGTEDDSDSDGSASHDESEDADSSDNDGMDDADSDSDGEDPSSEDDGESSVESDDDNDRADHEDSDDSDDDEPGESGDSGSQDREDSSGISGVGHETESDNTSDTKPDGEGSDEDLQGTGEAEGADVQSESGDDESDSGSEETESGDTESGDVVQSDDGDMLSEDDKSDEEVDVSDTTGAYDASVWEETPDADILANDQQLNGAFDPSQSNAEPQKPPPPSQGTLDEFEAVMSRYGGHEMLEEMAGDDNLEDITGSPEGRELDYWLKDLLRAAISQSGWFDNPSGVVSGVDVIPWPTIRFGHTWSQAPEFIVDSFMPERGELSRAILITREAFDNNRRSKTNRDLRSGRIQTSVLARRVPTGDDRLFGTKIIPRKKSHFVQIVIDASNSTNRQERMSKIKRLVFMQAQILSTLGIDFAIFAHSAGVPFESSDTIYDYIKNKNVHMYIQTVKGRDEKWGVEQKSKLAGLNGVAWNLDGHALEHARKLVEVGRETERIILYYSDGEMPSYNVEEETVILKSEVNRCKKNKITLLGVGINTNSPSAHGMSTVRVDTDRDIINVAEQLVKALTGKV